MSKRFWAVVLSVCLLVMTVPAFSADTPKPIQDLKNNSPLRHKYFFSVLGGAAIGAGVGALLGGGNDITKGLLVGGGGASAAYLHGNRRAGGAYRPWYMLAGDTALGSGIGWTICGCNDGLAAGTLVGFGASALWQTTHPTRVRGTAQQRRPARP